jgi:hypothetical protein
MLIPLRRFFVFRWKHNAGRYNGFFYPKHEIGLKHDWKWQIQSWMLYSNEYLLSNVDGRSNVERVMTNDLTGHEDNPYVKKIDLAFWSHGLHDWGWWDRPPYGERYFKTIVQHWQRLYQLKGTVPSVFISMNNECIDKIVNGMLSHERKATQFDMVEDAIFYMNTKMREEKLPYWDATSVLRTPERCEHSDDGVHVKSYVDILRAKMLFSYLCDENMNWRSDVVKAFIK